MSILSSKSQAHAPAALFALCALLGGCAQSCQKTAGPRAAKDDLALVPRETDIVLMANVKRARSSPVWKKFLEFKDKDAASKKQYDDFVQKCHLDPAQQIDSAFLALPQDPSQSREFALLLRGTFQGESMIECLKTTARENGKEVTETQYNGHKVYALPGQDGAVTLLDKQVAVLAGKEWVKQVIDLHDDKLPGGGARDNPELAALMKRVRIGDDLWGAGLVPPSAAQRLKDQPQLGVSADLKRIFGSLDLAKGLALYLTLDLGTPQEATDLSKRVSDQLAAARKEPRVAMMGLTSYFDAIKVSSSGPAFSVQVLLNQQQVDDLSMRLSGLARGLGLGIGRDKDSE